MEPKERGRKQIETRAEQRESKARRLAAGQLKGRPVAQTDRPDRVKSPARAAEHAVPSRDQVKRSPQLKRPEPPRSAEQQSRDCDCAWKANPSRSSTPTLWTPPERFPRKFAAPISLKCDWAIVSLLPRRCAILGLRWESRIVQTTRRCADIGSLNSTTMRSWCGFRLARLRALSPNGSKELPLSDDTRRDWRL